jgi:hypothetical protein
MARNTFAFLKAWIMLPCLLSALSPILSFGHSKMIRKVEVDPSQVTEIHTAMGYSTILDFSEKPLSAVLGDQDAFKLEFVGSSITVKPLVSRARSNLFVFTEFERFNIQLSSGNADFVDYIVHFYEAEENQGAPQPIDNDLGVATEPASTHSRSQTTPIHRSRSYGGITLKVVSKAKAESQIPGRATTVIDIELSSSKRSYTFSPASIGVKVGGEFIPVESIYLDTLSIGPNQPAVHGKIALLDQDQAHRGIPVVVFAVSDSTQGSKSHRLEVSTLALSSKSPKAK